MWGAGWQDWEVTVSPALPRVEFPFSQHTDGTSVRRAIQQLSYKSGNTRTGAGFRYVADNFFGPTQRRPGVPQVCAQQREGRSVRSIGPMLDPTVLAWPCRSVSSSRMASPRMMLKGRQQS